jgi:hypothetical protein
MPLRVGTGISRPLSVRCVGSFGMDIQRTPPQSDHCILCGAVPPPPLTGEHIWPDWDRSVARDRQVSPDE